MVCPSSTASLEKAKENTVGCGAEIYTLQDIGNIQENAVEDLPGDTGRRFTRGLDLNQLLRQEKFDIFFDHGELFQLRWA
jgi:hypothetical protein